MSTGTRIPLLQALRVAEDFARLFDGCWERWVIAGSVRRQMPDVGDIEHVVIPKMGVVAGTGLFAEAGNMLWQRCDDLVASGEIVKALYGDKQQTRWGDKYRGIVWRGAKHEVFTADAANFGCILAVRTGPAEFSRAMVTKLKADGLYHMAGGYLRKGPAPAEPPPRIREGSDVPSFVSKIPPAPIVPCPDEETLFAAVEWKFKKPEERR